MHSISIGFLLVLPLATAIAQENAPSARICLVPTSAQMVTGDVAYSFKSKDELELTYRLDSPTGAVLIDKTEKRAAKSDGEDVLTPLVEKASEAIAAVAAKGGK